MPSTPALKELPVTIGGFMESQLQHINLCGCSPLKDLPKRIGGLRSLQYLNLSKSNALDLPELKMSLLVQIQF